MKGSLLPHPENRYGTYEHPVQSADVSGVDFRSLKVGNRHSAHRDPAMCALGFSESTLLAARCNNKRLAIRMCRSVAAAAAARVSLSCFSIRSKRSALAVTRSPFDATQSARPTDCSMCVTAAVIATWSPATRRPSSWRSNTLCARRRSRCASRAVSNSLVYRL